MERKLAAPAMRNLVKMMTYLGPGYGRFSPGSTTCTPRRSGGRMWIRTLSKPNLSVMRDGECEGPAAR